MPTNFTIGYYAAHYESIQRAKYEQAWPLLEPLLPKEPFTMLDVGIGPGWFEKFLAEKKIVPSRIVGVDVSEEAITPKKENVTYIIDGNFHSEEKFDVVVCWDSFHLLSNKRLFEFVKPNGVLLVSSPPAFQHGLKELSSSRKSALDLTVGDLEKSRVLVFQI